MTSPIFLSIVIPAYNEEARIAASLEAIYRYMAQQTYPYELIVVDDGSTDLTASIVSEIFQRKGHGILLRNATNRGKGYSVRCGVLQTQGTYVLFSDADLSTPIREVEKFFPYLEQGYDITIGSRGLQESDVQIHQAWYREYMGKTFNRIVRILLLRGFADTQCGFKCFRGEVARKLFVRQQITHFSFDVEILFLAHHHHYRVKEVPIQWFNEPHSRVNALHDSAKMFIDLLKIRYNAWAGKYE
ncbi:glycosyltransferase [candidate division KSB3 bacterium]|uniref:dolichyl-phosphate beta-glucosyltransferase n=1 Tax=candidate division KSB3 bacterium TaxID=2044937 RepID=A0A9D5JU29_9BACT|nr:glycosyltransferase [candidate division KSB3 bacterium]MBD3323962.1 glycosyltransferase [candidate division KSB3 bacterium]